MCLKGLLNTKMRHSAYCNTHREDCTVVSGIPNVDLIVMILK